MKVPVVLAVMALIALPILAAPKPTPTPAANRIRNASSGPLKEGTPVTPTPTAGPVKMKADMSRDTFREGQPQPSICARLVNGKIEHYPCPEGAEVQKGKNVPPPQPTLNTKSNILFKEGAPGTPTPTVGPVGVNPHGTFNNSHSSNYKEGAPGTPTPTVGPVNKTACCVKNKGSCCDPPPPPDRMSGQNTDDSKQKGPSAVNVKLARVLSQQGRRLTVQLSNGQTVAVDSSSLNPIPRVGSTVTVTESRGNWVIVTR